MDNCTNCKNALFDEIWGEYKCKIDKKKHSLEGQLAGARCGYHKKGTPGIAQGVIEDKI